jgi:hypothetical protein
MQNNFPERGHLDGIVDLRGRLLAAQVRKMDGFVP